MNPIHSVAKDLNPEQKQITSLKAGALLLGMMIAAQANVQAQENDWPCAQILVTTVTAAVVWPYPLDQKLADRWLSNAEIKTLATKLASQFSAGDDEVALIAQFLGDTSLANRSEAATGLFMATLNEFNLRRQKYIKGIQKFTKKQKGLAQHLISLLEQRDNLSATETSPYPLTEEIAMVEQIFRNRENILIDLCEQPVRIEENLGVVARAIAEYVK